MSMIAVEFIKLDESGILMYVEKESMDWQSIEVSWYVTSLAIGNTFDVGSSAIIAGLMSVEGLFCELKAQKSLNRFN